MVISLDYASLAPLKPRTGLRFCLIVLVGGLVGFVVWCMMDFIFVRFAPSHIRDFDWLLLLFPLPIGLAGAVFLRHLKVSLRVALSIATAVLASIVAIVLILFVGIPFHFFIGGKL